VNKRADELFTTLVDSVPRQPVSRTFDVGESTFPYALDSSQSESTPVLGEAQRICQSGYDRFYMRGDTTAGGNLRYEKRSARLNPVPVATFGDTMVGMTAPYGRGRLVNRVKATAHPRRVDTVTTTVLFTNQGAPAVAAGNVLVLTGHYTDPAARAIRVGGTDMTIPVATTDYTMNAAADGSGADLTANFTVTAVYGANSVEYTINNGGGTNGFITKLQARGRGLYDYDAVDGWFSSTTSIATYGVNELALDMPYQTDLSTLAAIGIQIIQTWATTQAIQITLQLFPTNVAERQTVMSIEPGDSINLLETVTGISGLFYFVNHVSLRFAKDDLIEVEWVMHRSLTIVA
jgi:hypothetical protein